MLGAFFSAGFFIWGMGAFDPRMSVHGEEPEAITPETREEEETASGPMGILVSNIWQITFWLVVMVVLAVAVQSALPPACSCCAHTRAQRERWKSHKSGK